jgi:hypothetical protein
VPRNQGSARQSSFGQRQPLREAEVKQLDSRRAITFGYKQVLRFQVAVYQTLGMYSVEHVQQL